MRIPLVDVAAQHAELAEEIEPLLLAVVRSGHLVGGPHVAAFERAYADFVGTAHGLGVANGTDAIEIALRAVGVGAGDEVIVPGNTFIATAEAASRIGARPVPVDVDPVHLLIDPDAVAAAVTPRTSAIVPVHLYGQVAPMEQLTTIAAAHGLPIVEDAAQAQGARRNGRSAGAWGLAAATSLYPGKNLGAYGDAGAITTGDAEVDARMRLAANHGSREKYVHEVVGMNSRLDAVQAAVLTVKLRHLPAWNARRREIAERYGRLIEGGERLQLPKTMAGNEDAWHLYVIRVDDREGVRAALGRADIEAGVHYPQPWYLSPAYEHLGYRAGTCPVTEDAAARILSLPIHPHLDQAQQERVVDALHQAVNS